MWFLPLYFVYESCQRHFGMEMSINQFPYSETVVAIPPLVTKTLVMRDVT